MNRASLAGRIWYETSVPVFLERFILPALATVLIGVILLNPLKLDFQQQASLAIAVIAIAYFVGHTVHRLNQERKGAAEIHAKDSSVGKIEASDVLLSPNGGSLPILEIGDSGAMLAWGGPSGSPMFNFFNDSKLIIERINGKVAVSTRIRGASGTIAEIIRNEWKLRPSLVWDKNFNVNALEVKDDDGYIVLQVVALSDRIRLQAVWRDTEGHSLAIIKSHDPARPGGRMVLNRPIPESVIEPMFVYPSDSHFGELVKQ